MGRLCRSKKGKKGNYLLNRLEGATPDLPDFREKMYCYDVVAVVVVFVVCLAYCDRFHMD